MPTVREAFLRHAEHYERALESAGSLFSRGDAQSAGVALFDKEWPNIENSHTRVAAAVECGEADRRTSLLCIAFASAGSYLRSQVVHAAERARWAEVALRAARAIEDVRSELRLLGDLSLAYSDAGVRWRALEFCQQQLALARQLEDKVSEVKALGRLGLLNLRDPDARKQAHKQQLSIARDTGSKVAEFNALRSLGEIALSSGDTSRAKLLLRQALNIAHAANEPHLVVLAEMSIGSLYPPDEAIPYFQRLLDRARVDDPMSVGSLLGLLGLQYKTIDDVQTYVAYLREELAFHRAIGNRRNQGFALWQIASASADLGDTAAAIEHGEAAIELLETVGMADMYRDTLSSWRTDK